MRMACLTLPTIPVQAVAPPGWELVEYRYSNPFPSGPAAIQISDLIVAAAGLRAVEDGCDAIVVNTLADFGVKLLKEVLHGPVVGACYAAVSAAATLGDRFSLVSIWNPACAEIVQARFLEYGVADRCASMRFCTTDDNQLEDPIFNYDQLATCDLRYVDLVSREVQAVVTDDAPDAVILGCTCMSPAALHLEQRTAVPVIDASQVAVDLAASLGSRHGPMRVQEGAAARFWPAPLSQSIRELGERAEAIYLEQVGAPVP